MVKSDLVNVLMEQHDLTEVQAKRIIDLVFDKFVKTLQDGDRIEIRDFGVFTIKKYKAYTGRNPKTGWKIRVEAKKGASFKVGKELKEKINH